MDPTFLLWEGCIPNTSQHAILEAFLCVVFQPKINVLKNLPKKQSAIKPRFFPSLPTNPGSQKSSNAPSVVVQHVAGAQRALGRPQRESDALPRGGSGRAAVSAGSRRDPGWPKGPKCAPQEALGFLFLGNRHEM